jgi:ADP-ribose pyrophosphatase YjhB (NUDIX family)
MMDKPAVLPLLSGAARQARPDSGGAPRTLERVLGRVLLIIYAIRRASWRITRPITLNARVLVVDHEQILLVRVHGARAWHLPGGGVKRREGLAEAAVREVLEETGCRVQIERLLGMYVDHAEYKSEHIAIFVARPLSGLRVRHNLEIAEAHFFPLDALPSQLFPAVRARLEEYRGECRGVVGRWSERVG